MNILENQQLAEPVDGIYIDLEAQILQNIARHLQGWEQPIDTDRWLMQKLAEIGKLNQENIRLIAKMSGLSQTAAERMLNEAAQDAIDNMEPGLRYMARRGLAEEAVQADKSKNVKRVVHSFRKQAKDTLNMCNTVMLYKASEKYKGLVSNIAQEAWNILNSGAGGVVSGIESRQQAVRRCIRQLNDKGIPAFVDKRGREWTPEAYVNMAMRNTARSTAEEVQDARIRDAGCHLIQIDSHSGARPKCAKDQGKIFDLNNGSGYTEDLHGKKIQYYPWKSSSYGEPDGILGINCGHHKWPFIPGVNIQRHFPTEDMNANDKLYKQTQVQRALEREVRKQKRECMMLDAAGDQEGFEEASVKLKAKEAKLNHYVDQHDNLHRRKDREQVVGFDKRISAETIAANNRKIKEIEGVVDESRISQKNQKAAENWAKKHLGVKKTNYTKQPVDVVNQTNRALQRIYRENPVLKDFIDEIEFKDIDAVAQASIKIQGGKITTKLTLSPTKCSDNSAIQSMIDSQVKSGYWTNKRGLYGIAKHEATHLSEYALALKRYGVEKDTGTGNLQGAIRAIRTHEIAMEIKEKALNNCNMTNDYVTIKKNLCEYAASRGSGEFLAEACSEHKPRKLAKEVQRLFDEEMNK